MDLSKLTKGDRVLLGSSAVFLLSVFLPWFTIKVLGTQGSGNGFDVGFFWGTLPFLVVACLAGWVALKRFSTVQLPDDKPPLYLAGGATALLLPFLKLLLGEDLGLGVSTSRGFGLFLAVLSGAGVAFGGLLKFAEGGGKLEELTKQASTLVDQVSNSTKKPE